MIVEKRGNFLEATKEEKEDRVLILTCGIDGVGRSPYYWEFTKRYPISKDDKDNIKKVADEYKLDGKDPRHFAMELSHTNHPFKSTFLLVMNKDTRFSVSEPVFEFTLDDLIAKSKLSGYEKFIMPRLGLGDGLSWDFVKKTIERKEMDVVVYYNK